MNERLQKTLADRAAHAACLVLLEDLRLKLKKKQEAFENSGNASTVAGCALAMGLMDKAIGEVETEAKEAEKEQLYLAGDIPLFEKKVEPPQGNEEMDD